MNAEDILHEDNIPKIIILPNKTRYHAVWAKIHSRDEKNRPEDLTLAPTDRQIEITGGEEFIIIYVAEKLMVAP